MSDTQSTGLSNANPKTNPKKNPKKNLGSNPEIKTVTGPALALACLAHPGDGASALEEGLPRLSTFAALQGLWRPTLAPGETGNMVLIPNSPTQGETLCAVVVAADARPSGLLARHEVAAVPCLECHVDGPWERIQAVASQLEQTAQAQGKTPSAPWYCLFITNPRAEPPEDWKTIIRLPL